MRVDPAASGAFNSRMNFDPRLYVEIVPYEGARPPHPNPIADGHFDPNLAYKVLGVYNPSETSECYLMLANPERQIWFIPQRHVRAYRLLDSSEFFIPKSPTENGRSRNAAHGSRLDG